VFSGIVETQSQVLAARKDGELIRIDVEKPASFVDIKVGDSVCTNGVCLTVEEFDSKRLVFALGAETLKITGWKLESLTNAKVNLEQSLRFGDRIHGHMVSGHVDAVGEVISIQDLGGSTQVDVRAPEQLIPFVWKKGSWAINGVSLTVNGVDGQIVSQCLIPETLKRTNLGNLRIGARVNLEIDMMARGLVHYLETSRKSVK
jgi:riboflavin synthase